MGTLKGRAGGAADYAMPVKMEPAEAEKVVEAAYRLTDEIVKRQEEVRKERMENQSLMDQIAPFRRLDYEFKKNSGISVYRIPFWKNHKRALSETRTLYP